MPKNDAPSLRAIVANDLKHSLEQLNRSAINYEQARAVLRAARRDVRRGEKRLRQLDKPEVSDANP